MIHDVLIVDDERDISELISDVLGDEGYSTRTATDGPGAIRAVREKCPSIIILDIWLGDPQFDGLKVLEKVIQDYPHLPVIMMSGHGTVETAMKGIKLGAYDFVEKPFKSDRLLILIKHAIEASRLSREIAELKLSLGNHNELVGSSVVFNQLKQNIERIAPSNSRVLISGDEGVGKELIARKIHALSERQYGPFIIQNCRTSDTAAFEAELFGSEPRASNDIRKIGAFEKASHGTLLLDEICHMPLDTQAKIVRVLHESSFVRVGGEKKVSVDVRVIASSSDDIKQAVEQGTLREDLYYRLNVVHFEVPSLKDRREDVPQLGEYFIQKFAAMHGKLPCVFSEQTCLTLQGYDWPGNIRQLRNVMEWLLIMYGSKERSVEITPDILPVDIVGVAQTSWKTNSSSDVLQLPLREAREFFERGYLISQVKRFAGNISQTANFVGMERSALHRKLRALDVKRTA